MEIFDFVNRDKYIRYNEIVIIHYLVGYYKKSTYICLVIRIYGVLKVAYTLQKSAHERTGSRSVTRLTGCLSSGISRLIEPNNNRNIFDS